MYCQQGGDKIMHQICDRCNKNLVESEPREKTFPIKRIFRQSIWVCQDCYFAIYANTGKVNNKNEIQLIMVSLVLGIFTLFVLRDPTAGLFFMLIGVGKVYERIHRKRLLTKVAGSEGLHALGCSSSTSRNL